MADDLSMLKYTFDLYYNKAKALHEEGKIELAKRNYYLAAQQLIKMAKQNQGKLKQAQIDRANRLMALADSIEDYTPATKTTTGAGRDGVVRNPRLKQTESGEEGKIWTAASIPDMHFDDIAGLDDVKHAITMQMINPIKYPEHYAAYGKKTGGGVLLYGPPGTGKTMIARAIACEVGATFYVVKGSDIMSKYVGESEQNIKSLFDAARSVPRAIIFIDEMDSLFGERGKDIHNDKRVNEFLQQIDGFVGQNPNILLLGATNRPWDVDSAAVRSGRFSIKIYVPLPDAPARRFMLKKYLGEAPTQDIDMDRLVALTEGYSGADIAQICDLAKEKPLNEYIRTSIKQPITQRDLERAIEQVIPVSTPEEIKRFEEYSGRRNTMKRVAPAPARGPDPRKEDEDKKEDKKDIAPKPEDKPEDAFIPDPSEIQLLPETPPKITFSSKNKHSDLYIVIDGNKYFCKNLHFSVWQSSIVRITTTCTKEVEVWEGTSLQGKFNVNFIKGIKEEDMGI